MVKRLLTTQETAEFLNVSVAFLERDRWQGALIPFIKIGRRSIRYDLKILENYIKTNTKNSTSEL